MRFSGRKRAIQGDLSARGLWEEFVTIREGFRAQGHSANAAWERAYQQVLTHPPPPPRLPTGSEEGLKDSLIPPIPVGFLRATKAMFAGRPAESTVEALQWAARHAVVEDVQPSDANSALALYFLSLARTSQSLFASLLAKLLPSRSEVDSGKHLDEGDGDLIAMNRRLQEAFVDVAAPGAVK